MAGTRRARPDTDRGAPPRAVRATGLVRRFRAPPAGQTALALEARLEEAGAFEAQWLRVVAIAPDTLVRGVLLDEPRVALRYRRGDTVSVGTDAVLDWYAVDGGERVGDFLAAARRARADFAAAAERELPPAVAPVVPPLMPPFGAPDVAPSGPRAPQDERGAAPAWMSVRCH